MGFPKKKAAADTVNLLMDAAKKGVVRVGGPLYLLLVNIMIHAFGEKAREQMPSRKILVDGAIKGKARDPKDPHQEFIDAFHFLGHPDTKEICAAFKKFCPDFRGYPEVSEFFRKNKLRFGFPSRGIKAAMAEAASAFNLADSKRQIFRVISVWGKADPEIAEITNYGDIILREDSVKLANGSFDLRYRPEVWDACLLADVSWIEGFANEASVLNILKFAGQTIGLGEDRSSKGGSHGCFRPVSVDSIKKELAEQVKARKTAAAA